MTRTEWKRWLPYGGLPLLGAALWLYRQGGEPAELLLGEALAVLGYLAALEDLRSRQIPNRLVGAMLGAWVLILVPQLFFRTEYALRLLVSGAAGFALAGLVFLTVYWISRKGLGGGDVKLAAAAGLYLGMDILPAMLWGSVLAAAAGIGLLLAKKIGRRDAIPLAPFLYAGMLLALFSQS